MENEKERQPYDVMTDIHLESFIAKTLKKYKWFYIIGINILFLIIAYTRNIPFNETNDDTGMSAIASGAYGTKYREYLVFQNIIIGKVLNIFYNISPEINWYSLGQFVLTFSAFFLLGYIIIEKIQETYALVLYALFISIFYQEFFLIYQFTRVSMLCCLTGYLLIVFSFINNKSKWIAVLGIVMLSIGFMVRFSGFKEITIFAVILGGCCIILNKQYYPIKEHKKFWMEGTIFFCVMCALILMLYSYNKYYICKNEEWKSFQEFNYMRSFIQDRGGQDYWPDYVQNQQEYESYGISKNDFDMYHAAIIGDKDVLDMQTMQKLYAMKERFLQERSIDLKQCIKYLLSNVIVSKFFLFNLLLILLYMVLYKRSHFDLLIIGNVLVYLFIYIYLYLDGRVVERVIAPTNMALLMITIFCMDKRFRKQNHFKLSKMRMVTSIFLLGFVFASGMSAHYEELKLNRQDASQLYEILEDKNKIFVAGHDVFRWNYYFFDAYHLIPENFYSNQINIGGWLAQTPIIEEIKKNNGIDNVFQALLEKDNIYFYTKNSEEMVSTYLTEHYAKSKVGYSICKITPICKIVRFSENFQNDLKDFSGSAILRSVDNNEKIANYTNIEIQLSLTDNRLSNHVDTKFYLELRNRNLDECYTYYFNDNLEDTYLQKTTNIVFTIPNKQIWSTFQDLGTDCEARLFLIQDDNTYVIPITLEEDLNNSKKG